jgi:hypothetical protein
VSDDIKVICRPHQNHRFVTVTFPGDDAIAHALRLSLDRDMLSQIQNDSDLILPFLSAPYNTPEFANALVDSVIQEGLPPSVVKIWGNFDTDTDVEKGRGQVQDGEIVKFFADGKALCCRLCDVPLLSYKYTASLRKQGIDCDICSTCYHMRPELDLLNNLKHFAFGLRHFSFKEIEWDFESLTKNASQEDLPIRGFPRLAGSTKGSESAVYSREIVQYDLFSEYSESKCEVCGDKSLYLPVFVPISPFATVFGIPAPNQREPVAGIKATSLTLHPQCVEQMHPFLQCRWQPGNGGLLASCDNSSLCIWAKDLKTLLATANIGNQLKNEYFQDDDEFTCFDWDPSGRMIATGTSNSKIIIWQIRVSEKTEYYLSKLTTLSASENPLIRRADDGRSQKGFSVSASQSRYGTSHYLDDEDNDGCPVKFVAWQLDQSLLKLFAGLEDRCVVWFAKILSSHTAAGSHNSAFFQTLQSTPSVLFSQNRSPDTVPMDLKSDSKGFAQGTLEIEELEQSTRLFTLPVASDFGESVVLDIEGLDNGDGMSTFALAPNMLSNGLSQVVVISDKCTTLFSFVNSEEELMNEKKEKRLCMELVDRSDIDVAPASVTKINCVAFSHDGSLLAIGKGCEIVLKVIDEHHKLTDYARTCSNPPYPTEHFEHSGTVLDLAWTPSKFQVNNYMLASIGQDKFCIVWQVSDASSPSSGSMKKTGNLTCLHRIPFPDGCSSISWVALNDGTKPAFKLVVSHGNSKSHTRYDLDDESSIPEQSTVDKSVICSKCFNDPSKSTVSLLHGINALKKSHQPPTFFKICGPKMSPNSLQHVISNRNDSIMKYHSIRSSVVEEVEKGIIKYSKESATKSASNPTEYQMLRPRFHQQSPHLDMGPMNMWDVAKIDLKGHYDKDLKMAEVQLVEPVRSGFSNSCRWWYPLACLQPVQMTGDGSEFSPPEALAKGLFVSILMDDKRVFGTVQNDYPDDSKLDTTCKLLLEGNKIKEICWDLPSASTKGSRPKDKDSKKDDKSKSTKDKCWCMKVEKTNERSSRALGQDLIDACLKVEKAHKGLRCSGLKCKDKKQDYVLGNLYSCSQCVDFHFCDDCFKGKERHINGHKFTVKVSPTDVSSTTKERPFRNHERRVPLDSLDFAKKFSLTDTSPAAVKDAIRLAGGTLGPRNIHAVIILRSIDFDASSTFKLKLEVLGYGLHDQLLERISVSGEDDVHRNVYLLREEFCGHNVQMIVFDNDCKEPSPLQSMRYVISVVDATGNSSDAFKKLKTVANGTRVVLYDFSFEDDSNSGDQRDLNVDADTRIDVIMHSKDTGDETHDSLKNASLRPDVAFLSSMRCKAGPVWIVGVVDFEYKNFVDQKSSKSFVSRSRSLQFKYLIEGYFFTHNELKQIKNSQNSKEFKKNLYDLCESESVKMSDDTLKDLRNMSYSDEITDISELAASVFPPVLKILTRLCSGSDINASTSLHPSLLQLLSYIAVYSASSQSRYTCESRKLLKSFAPLFRDSLSTYDSQEIPQSEVILDLLRHVFINPAAVTMQPTCRILLSLQRAVLLTCVQEQVFQFSVGKAVQSYVLQRSYFETFSLAQAMSTHHENTVPTLSCPVIFGHILTMSLTQLYSYKDLYKKVLPEIGKDQPHVDARVCDTFNFMCRAASLVLGSGPELTLVVDGKRSVVAYDVVPMIKAFQRKSDIDNAAAPAVASLQLKLIFPGGTIFYAAKVEIAATTQDFSSGKPDVVDLIFTQADNARVTAKLSLKNDRHLLNQLLWMCRCVEIDFQPFDAKLHLKVPFAEHRVDKKTSEVRKQIRAWTQLDVFSLVFFIQPITLRTGPKPEEGPDLNYDVIENTAQIMGWSLVLDELLFTARFFTLFFMDSDESTGAKAMARMVYNRCRRWAYAKFSPSKVFVANCEPGINSIQMKVIHNVLGSNGASIPITPKLQISHDGGTTWVVIEKLRLRRRNIRIEASATLTAAEVWISTDQNKTSSIVLRPKTEECIKELLCYSFEYSSASDLSDVACNFRSIFTQPSMKDEDALRFAFHLWNFCCYCGIAWESADVPKGLFVFDRSILPASGSQSNGQLAFSPSKDDTFNESLLRLCDCDANNEDAVAQESTDTQQSEVIQLFEKSKSDSALAAQLSSLSEKISKSIATGNMSAFKIEITLYLRQLKSMLSLLNKSAMSILSVLEPVPFDDANFEPNESTDLSDYAPSVDKAGKYSQLKIETASHQARLRNWPVFFKGKDVVDHVHVVFTAELQATVEPVKADLTTLDFQIRVKKWQRELDRPIWLESQSSVQKFWSRSIDQSVQVFVQSIFQDLSVGPVHNSQLFVSSRIGNANNVGQWKILTCFFDVNVVENESQLRMSLKADAIGVKHFEVKKLSRCTDHLFYLHNPKIVVRPLAVEVVKQNGRTKTYFVYPSPGHEACVHKLLRLWRLALDNKYSHVTQNTVVVLKNAFATIPRLYRSDPDKFGEVMCLFQSLSHEDAPNGLRFVTEIFCQYEQRSLRKPNPVISAQQFTGLRSLRMCLRNFSDQKETLCCVLVLLLKLLLWKQTSTEDLAIDESGDATQVPFTTRTSRFNVTSKSSRLFSTIFFLTFELFSPFCVRCTLLWLVALLLRNL